MQRCPATVTVRGAQALDEEGAEHSTGLCARPDILSGKQNGTSEPFSGKGSLSTTTLTGTARAERSTRRASDCPHSAMEIACKSACPEEDGSCHPQIIGMNFPLEVLPCSPVDEESLDNLHLHIKGSEIPTEQTQEICSTRKNGACVFHSSSLRSVKSHLHPHSSKESQISTFISTLIPNALFRTTNGLYCG